MRTTPNAPLSRWWLAACLAVYAALAGLLVFRVPLQTETTRTASGVRYLRTAPDEGAHFEYVAHLAETGKLPVFKPLGANAPGYEFHQPPLYYAICALPWKLLDGGSAARYACRLVSLLCGAATLALLWQSAVALFPARRKLPLLATGFMALWPLHINVGAAAGPDALTDLWCAALFFLIARAAQNHHEGRTWHLRDSLLMGGVLGLGLLTKNTPLALAPIALLAAWMFARPSQDAKAQDAKARDAKARDAKAPDAERKAGLPLWNVLVVAGVAGVLVSGWWARNTILYGDPLAAQVFDEAFRQSSLRPADYFSPEAAAAFGQQITLVIYVRAWLLVAFSTSWGLFGGPNTAGSLLNIFGTRDPAPEAFLALPFILLCAVASLAAVLGLLRAARHWPQLPASTRRALGLWLGGGVLIAFSLAQFNLIQFQAQARYLHPAALPIALALALGWRTLWTHSPRRVLWRISAALFTAALLVITLWNAFGWRTLV
jgi:hypothetical protein